jgi:hypothetical protein
MKYQGESGNFRSFVLGIERIGLSSVTEAFIPVVDVSAK